MARSRTNVDNRALLEAALVGYEAQKAQIEAQIQEVRRMLGGRPAKSEPAAPEKAAPKKRQLSASARKRIAAAQKRRWAAFRKAESSGEAGSEKPAKKKA